MATSEGESGTIAEAVRMFLAQNFPQIKLHGGDATVVAVDPADGVVEIRLSGACSGCGISPMTVQAIQHRLPAEHPDITDVVVTIETDTRDGDGRHAMGGHPAGGMPAPEFGDEIPDWRTER